MSTHHDFYLERASEARRDAEATPLQNVRERCLRAAEAWEQMAAGEQAAALATVEAALALTPEDPDLLSTQVCALVGLGRLDEARDTVTAMSAHGAVFAELLQTASDRGWLPFIDRHSLERVLSTRGADL